MRTITIPSPISPIVVQDESRIIQEIARIEGFKLSGNDRLSGGSINTVYRLFTSQGKMVLKLNSAGKFPGMFKAEEEGLNELRNSQTVDVPRVLSRGESNGTAYLLMEFKTEAPQKPQFWLRLAEDLAALHRNTQPQFGFYDKDQRKPSHLGL